MDSLVSNLEFASAEEVVSAAEQQELQGYLETGFRKGEADTKARDTDTDDEAPTTTKKTDRNNNKGAKRRSGPKVVNALCVCCLCKDPMFQCRSSTWLWRHYAKEHPDFLASRFKSNSVSVSQTPIAEHPRFDYESGTEDDDKDEEVALVTEEDEVEIIEDGFRV